MQQLMLFMKEECDRQVPNLLLGIFGGRDQINRLEVTEIDIVPLYVDVEQLADVFLLLIAIEIACLELLPDVGQFFIHPLLLQFAGSRIPQVCDELDQSTHGRHDAGNSPRSRIVFERYGEEGGKDHRHIYSKYLFETPLSLADVALDNMRDQRAHTHVYVYIPTQQPLRGFDQ